MGGQAEPEWAEALSKGHSRGAPGREARKGRTRGGSRGGPRGPAKAQCGDQAESTGCGKRVEGPLEDFSSGDTREKGVAAV